MTGLALALVVGIVVGMMVGLMPSITPTLGLLIVLPLVGFDPVVIFVTAIVIQIGSQFFGSQAVLWYRLPGENSSFPTLIEANNFDTPSKVYQAVITTTIGSLVATLVAVLTVTVVIASGMLHHLTVPILVRALVYTLLIIMAFAFPVNRLGPNIACFALMMIFPNWEHISVASQGVLPMYYFSNLFALVIMFSMQAIWNHSGFSVKGDSADFGLLRDFSLRRWIGRYLGYSCVGVGAGLVPQLGPSISSYTSWGIEKLMGNPPLNRVAAAETANNSAVLTAWLPLLLFGIPITGVEIVLLQYFVQHGMDFRVLLESSNILIFAMMALLAGIIYTVLALRTNKTFYQYLGSMLSDRRFSIAIAIFTITVFVLVTHHTWEMVVVHLLVFVPLSWIIHRIGGTMLTATIALLLSNEILFNYQQILEIYF